MKRRILITTVSLALLLLAVAPAVHAEEVGIAGADAEFVGEFFTDDAGKSVAFVGDVNGDGFDDLLIGAPDNDGGGDNAGAAYLVLGRPHNWGSGASGRGWGQGILLDGTGIVKYIGESDGDRAGYSVAGAGDVDGDGFDDFLIGAPYDDDGGEDAGAVYLILGAGLPAGGSLSGTPSLDPVKYTGEAAGDNVGWSVDGAKSMNGDEYADFVVGAPGYSYDGAAGAAYLVFGSSGPTGGSLSLTRRFSYPFGGDAEAGKSVAGVGDVDGDGFADFLIGVPGANKVYLVRGNPSCWGGDLPYGSTEFILTYAGEASGDEAGTCVAGAGDVNGDGYADFLIGAPGNQDGGADAGAAYLVLGESDPIGSDLGNYIAYEGDAGSYLGGLLAGGGDVNGDGYADFFIDAQYGSASHLMFGSSAPDGDLSSAIQYRDREGPAWFSSAGLDGDADGDGYADLLFGYHVDSVVHFFFGDHFAGSGPIRQRQRIDDGGNANPVLFDQAGVWVDFTGGAQSGGDIVVERHVFHPCSTERRLQMPIWTVWSSKQSSVMGSDITLRFEYTNAQVAGMAENNLKVWARPEGYPCSEWEEVGGTVDLIHNTVTVTGLHTLGKQFTIAESQPSATAVQVTGFGVQLAQEPPWLVALLIGAALTTGGVYAYLRRRGLVVTIPQNLEVKPTRRTSRVRRYHHPSRRVVSSRRKISRRH